MTGTEDAPAPATPAAPITEHELYLRWLEKRKQVVAEREQQAREQADTLTRQTESAASLALGKAADDGKGKCKWCGLVLGHNAEGLPTHPLVRECPGPRPENCTICGGAWQWSATIREWHHPCSGRKAAAPRAQQLERIRDMGTNPAGGGTFGFRRDGGEE